MTPLVRCSQCQGEGKKSTVTPVETWTTAMYCAPFYDEEGRLHVHDLNTSEISFTCSNGHRWSADRPNECWWEPNECWCGWTS